MNFFKKIIGSAHHLYIAPFIVCMVAAVFFTTVDLEPKLTSDFFFSSDSKIYKKNQQVKEKFPFQKQVIVSVTTKGPLTDPNYIEKVANLTDRIGALKGIKNVQSITKGPDDLEAARENPLWQRLLIGTEPGSSFVIAFIKTDDISPLIKKIEDIVNQEENKWFTLRISGLPYIVEQIRRNLQSDMKTFTLGAIVLSSLMLLAVFRSFAVVFGALMACITAAMLTLIIQGFFGVPIGILTANLGAIVFVLTLSHIIFLVSNWHNAAKISKTAKLRETIDHTLPASFWAGLTTFIGFASLSFVEAKPLNQLGIGGSIGTAAAFICAYTIFPAFLRIAKVNPTTFTYALAQKFPLSNSMAKGLTRLMILAALMIGLMGIANLKTDPSLLSYFKEDSKLYKGLYQVDKNGGSNPLLIVVSRRDGKKLDNDNSYEKMWDLQTALSNHESVGSIISLPVIMAEGDEHWLGKLLPWDILLDQLSKPKFGAIARSFMTADRTEALFMIRMKESGRDRDRLSILEEIKDIPQKHGFQIENIGGTYYLQGELAASVKKSMVKGIVTLILLFGAIAYFAVGAVKVALAVMLCAGMSAALVLGTLGLLRVPVDIISSPSMNICLGLIVDSMIHLTMSAKRHAKKKKDDLMQKWSTWKAALDTQSWPAIVSTLTVMIGFSVFGLSDFPPSQRFGLEIVYGSGLAVIIALGVFPYILSQKAKD